MTRGIKKNIMKKAFLKRQNDNGKATIGILFFEIEGKVTTLSSLELPWLDNKCCISCIPKGTYKVITSLSTKYKKQMWEVLDVEGRSGIRIHSANYSNELEGCIALGLHRVDINNDETMDVLNSRKAIQIAKSYLGKEFELEIL